MNSFQLARKNTRFFRDMVAGWLEVDDLLAEGAGLEVAIEQKKAEVVELNADISRLTAAVADLSAAVAAHVQNENTSPNP